MAAGCATSTTTPATTAPGTQPPTGVQPSQPQPGQPSTTQPGLLDPMATPGEPATTGQPPANPASNTNLQARTTAPPHRTADLASKTWQQRMNIEFELFKSRDRAAFDVVMNLQPDEKTRSGRLLYTDKRLRDPRVAPVLLHRLISEKEKPKVRRAIAEALPMTGGDWEEAASHLLVIEADPDVRLALVRCMRHSKSPYDLKGLRVGLKDEKFDVQVAALETAGYVANGKVLRSELLSATFDERWEKRAAAIRSLGNLREVRSWRTLVRALSDRKAEVRLQALIGLEKIDANKAAQLPELSELAKDSSLRVARRAKALIKQTNGGGDAEETSEAAPSKQPAAVQ